MKFKIKKQLLNEEILDEKITESKHAVKGQQRSRNSKASLEKARKKLADEEAAKQKAIDDEKKLQDMKAKGKELKQKTIEAFTKALKGIAWMDGDVISFEEKPEGKDYIISDDDFDQKTINFDSLKKIVEDWQTEYQNTPKDWQDYEAAEDKKKTEDSRALKEETDALEAAAKKEATRLVGTISDYYYTKKNISKDKKQEAFDKLSSMVPRFKTRSDKVKTGAQSRQQAKIKKQEDDKKKEILNKMSSVSPEIKSLNAAAKGTEGLEFELNDFKKVMKAMVDKLDEQEQEFFKEKIFSDPIGAYLGDKKEKEAAKTSAETEKQTQASKAEQDKQTAEKQKVEKPIVDAMKILNNFTLKDGDAYRLDDDFIRDHKDEIKNAIKLLTTHLMVLQETLKRYNNLLKEAPVSPPRHGNYEEQEQTNSKQQNAQPVAKKLQFDINDKEQILKLLKAIKERLKKIEGEDSSKDQAQKAGEQDKAAKGKILNDIITILDFFKDDVEIGKGFEVAANKKSWFGLGKNKRQAQADQIAKEWKGAKSFVKYLADNLPKIDKEQKVGLIKKYGDTIANIGEIFGESNITNFVSLQESKKYKLNLIKNKRG